MYKPGIISRSTICELSLLPLSWSLQNSFSIGFFLVPWKLKFKGRHICCFFFKIKITVVALRESVLLACSKCGPTKSYLKHSHSGTTLKNITTGSISVWWLGTFCTIKLIFVCKMNLSSLILLLFSHRCGSGFAKLCDKTVTVFSGNWTNHFHFLCLLNNI